MKKLSPDVLRLLRSFVKKFPTKKAAATNLEVSAQYLSDLLHGRRAISDNIARKLGMKKTVTYEVIK